MVPMSMSPLKGMLQAARIAVHLPRTTQKSSPRLAALMQADPSDSQIYAADEDVDMPEVEVIPVEVIPDDKGSRQVEVIEHGG